MKRNTTSNLLLLREYYYVNFQPLLSHCWEKASTTTSTFQFFRKCKYLYFSNLVFSKLCWSSILTRGSGILLGATAKLTSTTQLLGTAIPLGCRTFPYLQRLSNNYERRKIYRYYTLKQYYQNFNTTVAILLFMVYICGMVLLYYAMLA